jgi:alpha-amylase/alpha-mannosidase (GH57 family)
MAILRLVVLWHQHQPFYKDLVTGEYRLPWVRLHGLKDYYGMVKLLDEFPAVHQTFNLVPSLMQQIEDYAAGTAHDPFLHVAAKPAEDLSVEERRFALQYLFQANPVNLIGRYPRYGELQERLRQAGGNPERAEKFFQAQDFRDLQVLSQIAWFDEFFLQEPEVAALVRKGRNFTLEEQRFVVQREREELAKILPAHAEAAKKGLIEISTSPFYHPILPLVADTNAGAVSSPGLPLPQHRFRRPEDAREQILRGLDLHEKVFGVRPRGMWPSEGSVSEEAVGIAHKLGVQWMATDEGVLGRSLGIYFSRDGNGQLPGHLGEKLYNIHRYDSGDTTMHLVFRDHTISDLIGFVYSGMPAAEAANHLMQNIQRAARPVLDSGRDAVMSIILDGENAWEYYPQSGREFLRRFYDRLQNTPGVEAVTVSEAIARHQHFGQLRSLVPGSWINANFNVWIGAPEDNRSWDYLAQAREYFTQNSPHASDAQRTLAYNELLIAEGSDWNWWYGPEHHSANDRDFDELYRKHLSNVYQALGASPPDALAQPIAGEAARPSFVRQTAYIHPRIAGDMVRYFEWLGAAIYTADQRAGAMHGKQFLLDSLYAGIDAEYVYGRLDFKGKIPEMPFELVVNVETRGKAGVPGALRLEALVEHRRVQRWSVTAPGAHGARVSSDEPGNGEVRLALLRNFEFRLPLAWLGAGPVSAASVGDGKTVRLRVSLWHNRLPVDSMPMEGWLELPVLEEQELLALA